MSILMTLLLQAAVSLDGFMLGFDGSASTGNNGIMALLELSLHRVPNFANNTSDYFMLDQLFTMSTAAASEREVSLCTS